MLELELEFLSLVFGNPDIISSFAKLILHLFVLLQFLSLIRFKVSNSLILHSHITLEVSHFLGLIFPSQLRP